MENSKPLSIAIVGRPNVGKSSLFNWLVRRRAAVVHSSAGVTRDRLTQPAEFAGRVFYVTDTGGLAPPGHADYAAATQQRAIAEAIQKQIRAALQTADAVIMTTDIQAGLTPLDAATADFLRTKNLPVFLAANKADNAALDDAAAEFYRLGFPVFPISAVHGRGTDALLKAIFAHFPEATAATGQTEAPHLKITVVGRPNVGKSSFINALLGEERLIVTDLPGTTRDCVTVPFALPDDPQHRRYLLTDTAGIRKISRLNEPADHIGLRQVERQIKHTDVAILMLDAAQGPTAADKKIAHLILAHAKGLVLALNKWDLLPSGASQREAAAALHAELPFLNFAPVLCISARTGLNLKKTIATAARVAEATHRRMPTGALNRVLHQAFEQTPPPLIKGRRLKIFYATQTGVAPIAITIFVNTPIRLTATYTAFLTHALRRAFDLTGAPIVIKVKSSHHPRPTQN